MAGSSRQLVASIDGAHKKRNTSRELVGQVLGGGASIRRPSRATSRPRADAKPCSLIGYRMRPTGGSIRWRRPAALLQRVEVT